MTRASRYGGDDRDSRSTAVACTGRLVDAAPFFITALPVLLVAACAAHADDDTPTVLVDTNPDPAIVEVHLVAEPATVEYLPGKPADVWAFRDAAGRASIPGPLLEANVGDQIIVHFENHLPAHTTIHWHGLRVPNAADGTPLSQIHVEPGGTYDYIFTASDPGLYWYHPHMDADVQIERGLYAPIRIGGGVEPDVTADRIFVLDDVKLEATGQLSTTTDNLDLMLGRQGNVTLVNGRAIGSQTLDIAAGARERWRFVDVANGRYFHLDLPGHDFLVIGWDGGPVAQPYRTPTLLVAPGERYDVLVEPTTDTALRNIYYDRGHDIPDPGPRELVAIHIGAPGPGSAPAPLPDRWGDVPAIPVDTTTPRTTFTLRETEGPPPTFSINGEMYPAITPLTGTSGDVVEWDIVNTAEMDHPFHLHGMFFQRIDDPRGWKDTINVPRMSTVRLAVRYGAPGRWMFHCHILEHAERGMMGELDLR
jgi:FtsP/CotA-like multicopper oxidase with cupredoxin domain